MVALLQTPLPFTRWRRGFRLLRYQFARGTRKGNLLIVNIRGMATEAVGKYFVMFVGLIHASVCMKVARNDAEISLRAEKAVNPQVVKFSPNRQFLMWL